MGLMMVNEFQFSELLVVKAVDFIQQAQNSFFRSTDVNADAVDAFSWELQQVSTVFCGHSLPAV